MIRSRCEFYKNFINENSSDQRKLFSATKKLLNHTDEVPYPPFNDKLKFANEMGFYFIEKTVNIRRVRRGVHIYIYIFTNLCFLFRNTMYKYGNTNSGLIVVLVLYIRDHYLSHGASYNVWKFICDT